MENAITYKDLYLSFGEVISMDRLEIVQSPNRHGRLRLSAVMHASDVYSLYDQMNYLLSMEGGSKSKKE